MEYVLGGIGALVVLVIAFVVWRYTSVARGARQRDEIILKRLDAIGAKLSTSAEVSAEEIASVAKAPENRPLLHVALSHFDELDLFPAEYCDRHSQAAARLSYWLMHPNEAGIAPAAIEPFASVKRVLDGETAEFLVLRYLLPDEPAENFDDWGLGLVGPFFENDLPYEGPHTAIARFGDTVATTNPEALIDWYIGVIESKAR